MEIHKVPVSPSALVALPKQREVAEKGDARRVSPSYTPAEREVKVYAHNPDEFESLIRQLEDSRASAGEYQPRHHATMLTNRAKQALSAYQAQQDLPQDQAHAVLQQLLGIDDYA